MKTTVAALASSFLVHFFDVDSPRGGGGVTWVFFGWVCAARDSKLALLYKKDSPKIDTPF